MAFNLKKVLKALLLSTNQPLAIKDIQAAFTRFHESGSLPFAAVDEAPTTGEENKPAENAAETPAEAAAPTAPDETEVIEGPQDPELYVDVPSLVTATQLREAMD